MAAGKHFSDKRSRPSGRPAKRPEGTDSEDFDFQLRRLYMQGAAAPDDGAQPSPEEETLPPEPAPAEAAEPPEDGASGENEEYESEELGRGRSARPPRPALRVLRVIGRVLAFLFSGVLLFALFLLGVMAVVTHGPSKDAERLFVLSANETSALKFLPSWYLPQTEIDGILHPAPVVVEPDTFVEIGYKPAGGESAASGETTGQVQVSTETTTDELEIIDIKESTFKGKLMIIHDPSRVVVGTLDSYGGVGLYLTDFIEKFGAVAGTNAGGFYDPDGQGDGGIPDGLVMRDGEIIYGNAATTYVDVIGFDANHILHVGDMSGQQALDLGLVSAVSFSQGPVLIQDGVKKTGLGGGVNPRTCIGQRSDGAVLLAVIEGRHPDSIGATYDDLADMMEEYGAVNAANLDGGSSSVMYYNGEQITKGSSLIGSRRMATTILVLP